ncbi:hypothetical protein AVEN_89592-1 [Araneus ventricosus]|uniref:Peptidase M12A domain-containing protein n=1 Tax=Araneus ventricosus TaxID=182803 RepID=A0A4Y2IJF2_ARAVE|nr:hypothetical protein AVEN_89592-1 [Araneus ventricosus]
MTLHCSTGAGSKVWRLQTTHFFRMGCEKYGTILHELPMLIDSNMSITDLDRSDYIIINWRNIEKRGSVQKTYRKSIRVDGFRYRLRIHNDVRQLRAFSSNGRMTIQRRDGEEIEENDELSDTDIEKLRLL